MAAYRAKSVSRRPERLIRRIGRFAACHDELLGEPLSSIQVPDLYIFNVTCGLKGKRSQYSRKSRAAVVSVCLYPGRH